MMDDWPYEDAFCDGCDDLVSGDEGVRCYVCGARYCDHCAAAYYVNEERICWRCRDNLAPEH